MVKYHTACICKPENLLPLIRHTDRMKACVSTVANILTGCDLLIASTPPGPLPSWPPPPPVFRNLKLVDLNLHVHVMAAWQSRAIHRYIFQIVVVDILIEDGRTRADPRRSGADRTSRWVRRTRLLNTSVCYRRTFCSRIPPFKLWPFGAVQDIAPLQFPVQGEPFIDQQTVCTSEEAQRPHKN